MHISQRFTVSKQGSLLLRGQRFRTFFEKSGRQGRDVSVDSRRTDITRTLQRDMHGIIEGIENRMDELIAIAKLQLKPRREFLRRLEFFRCQEQVAKQIGATTELGDRNCEQ